MHFIFYILIFYIFQKVQCQSIELIEGVKSELEKYGDLANEAVNVEFDRLSEEMEEAKLKIIIESQRAMARNVVANRCVNSLKPSTMITYMTAASDSASRCLLAQAAKGAAMETQLTSKLNYHRGQVMDGRNAMAKCELRPEIGPYKYCINGISNELKQQGEILMRELKYILERAILADESIAGKAEFCTKKAYTFINNSNDLINDLRACMNK